VFIKLLLFLLSRTAGLVRSATSHRHPGLYDSLMLSERLCLIKGYFTAGRDVDHDVILFPEGPLQKPNGEVIQNELLQCPL